MLTFNTDNMVRQNFAFPAPIMDYIFKNAQPEHLIKFYQCSKFFYNKFRRNIILNLEIVDDNEAEVLTPTKTVMCVSNPFLSKLTDCWITDSFIYRAFMPSKQIPVFTNCIFKKLELCQRIDWEEYEILTNSGTVEELKCKQYINAPDNIFSASVEDIIAQVPNAKSIEIYESIFTATTCASLSSMKHKANISNFVLKNITDFEFFHTRQFIGFFMKNANHDCNVYFDFELFPGTNAIVHEANEMLKKVGTKLCQDMKFFLEKKDILCKNRNKFHLFD
uniref:Uncharacterized protein n=1 Tax=Panagrolaimus sp. ES5 TaxID=591445 RepID=A0AC34FJS2_9BILA